jgi:hypothetical protein
MSRVQVTPKENRNIAEVVVGVDHVCGWFLQVWEHGIEEPIVDIDFLSNGAMLEKIIQYAKSDCAVNRRIRGCIALDLDPGAGIG